MERKVFRAAQAREESRYSMDLKCKRVRVVYEGRDPTSPRALRREGCRLGFSLFSGPSSSAVGASGVQSRGYGWKEA